ncbi:G-type lectin S-receptor-like serine/threonine-protein kinase LECRK4 [Triticum dicoccoides]|uniref:G-type lectin S-receptor-like serine/threonine-protein kinase LECRK4 n=1 Tax=Triticum dicoccoides TaxID=85692 RepID=UPI0018904F15|nr:G-type lectin S-receptor-like serine/threonine-protein kinase LECRK4 [Triticum dicoccoides]
MALYYLTRDRDSQRLLSSSVRSFNCKELYQATNGFKKLLGKGSFGEVYKGTIRSPQPHLIAVKKLIESNEYSEQEFTNEVQSIGSLRGFLFNSERRPAWRWRAEAALAIARGVEYLHDSCIAPIIHCDIKPDNILLDDCGIPKITDFGISKLLGSQQVHTTVTHVRGTRGYIAPEWLRGDARVDTKVDVYSFGVVLLEMICCRRCQEPVTPVVPQGQGMEDDETVTLFGWAAQLVVARRMDLMLHGDADVNTAEDMERVERFTRVALWCIEPNPLLRPTIHQVVQILETNDWVQVQALPDPPDCYMESSPLISQLSME